MRRFRLVLIVLVPLLVVGGWWVTRKSWVQSVSIIGFSEKDEAKLRRILEKFYDRCPALSSLELVIIRRTESADVIIDPSGVHANASLTPNIPKDVPLSPEALASYRIYEFGPEAPSQRVKKLRALLARPFRDGTDVLEIYDDLETIDAQRCPPVVAPYVPDRVASTVGVSGMLAHELAHGLMYDFPESAARLRSELLSTMNLFESDPGFVPGQPALVSETWVSGYAQMAYTASQEDYRATIATLRTYTEEHAPTPENIVALPELQTLLREYYRRHSVEEDGAETLAYLLIDQRYAVGRFAHMKLRDGERFLLAIG